MDKTLAEKIYAKFNTKISPSISLSEILKMEKIQSDGYDVYAIQKGDVTFAAWVKSDGEIIPKILCW